MTSKRKPYQTYPEAFKLEALRLLAEPDRPIKRRIYMGSDTIVYMGSYIWGQTRLFIGDKMAVFPIDP